MSQEYTQAQLERMVQGKPQEPTVVFYDQSKMDVDASKAAGRRVYNTVLMVKYTQPGVTDWAPQRAQKADIANNPEEYDLYLRTKDDVGSPSVTIIPGISPDESQELIDYGIVTITKLCEATILPAHLQHIQASARRLNEVLKHERQTNEQVHSQEAHKAEEMPAPDRRVDTADIGRPELPAGHQPQVGTATRGSRPGGRLDGGQGQARQEAGEGSARREAEQKVKQPLHPLLGVEWEIQIG